MPSTSPASSAALAGLTSTTLAPPCAPLPGLRPKPKPAGRRRTVYAVVSHPPLRRALLLSLSSRVGRFAASSVSAYRRIGPSMASVFLRSLSISLSLSLSFSPFYEIDNAGNAVRCGGSAVRGSAFASVAACTRPWSEAKVRAPPRLASSCNHDSLYSKWILNYARLARVHGRAVAGSEASGPREHKLNIQQQNTKQLKTQVSQSPAQIRSRAAPRRALSPRDRSAKRPQRQRR